MRIKVVDFVRNEVRTSMKRMRQFRNKLVKQRKKDYYISYAQSGEDIIVDFIFNNILNQPKFTYCDIGAHHSTHISNTALFYRKGMNGICIEPDPTLFEEIQRNRSKDICLNIGIGFSDKEEILDFFIMSPRSLNTFSRTEAERLDKEGVHKIVEVKKIQTINVNRIFEKHFIPDFLSIDVEGIDFEILKSIDLNTNRPRVICIETAEFSSTPPGDKIYDSIDYLKQNDYMFYADTYSNSIFLDNKYLKQVHNKQ
jgi:FkbM family methyltransferase